MAMSATRPIERVPLQHGCRRQHLRCRRDYADRTASENLGRCLHHAAATSENRVGYLNLTGRFDVRRPGPSTVSRMPRSSPAYPGRQSECEGAALRPPEFDAALLWQRQLAGEWPEWIAAYQSLRSECHPGRNRPNHTSTTTSARTCRRPIRRLFGHNNHFVIGRQLRPQRHAFLGQAELGSINQKLPVVGSSGIFLGNPATRFRMARSGSVPSTSISGVYALDTFDVTKALLDHRRRSLQRRQHYPPRPDSAPPLLNGNDTYTRFNPILAAPIKSPRPDGICRLLRGQSVRRPRWSSVAPIRRIPASSRPSSSSDPPLQQVVSHTWEAGFRGSHSFGPDIGTLTWKVGAFHTINSNDILSIPAPNDQGFGYFANVGSTRRQGIEAEASLTAKTVRRFHASYAFVDARFLDSLTLGSNSPFADANGNIQVSPGDQIPAIPRHRVKLGFDYAAPMHSRSAATSSI